MQLQIFFSNDSAWMNFYKSSGNVSIPLESVPLYFTIQNNKIIAGSAGRQFYFENFQNWESCANVFWGHAREVLKRDERGVAWLLYTCAKNSLSQKSPSDTITSIAIAALPSLTHPQRLATWFEKLTDIPTKTIPLHSFFADADIVALPVERKFHLGRFSEGQWSSLYSSPLLDSDMRIRSMSTRMAERFPNLSEQQKQAEILACEAYLEDANALSELKRNGFFHGSYKGISRKNLGKITVDFNRENWLTPNDRNGIEAIARNGFNQLEKSHDSCGKVLFVGDGYCFPEFSEPFENQKRDYSLKFISTEEFFEKISSIEWSAFQKIKWFEEKSRVPASNKSIGEIVAESTQENSKCLAIDPENLEEEYEEEVSPEYLEEKSKFHNFTSIDESLPNPPETVRKRRNSKWLTKLFDILLVGGVLACFYFLTEYFFQIGLISSIAKKGLFGYLSLILGCLGFGRGLLAFKDESFHGLLTLPVVLCSWIWIYFDYNIWGGFGILMGVTETILLFFKKNKASTFIGVSFLSLSLVYLFALLLPVFLMAIWQILLSIWEIIKFLVLGFFKLIWGLIKAYFGLFVGGGYERHRKVEFGRGRFKSCDFL